MFLLRVWDAGAEPPFDIPVRHDLQIGRAAPQGDCLLRDANAGRAAARIVIIDGRPHVEDMGSRNPTAIRGGPRLEKGERLALTPGMVIEIGRSSIMVVAEPQSGDVDPERTLPGDELGSATIVAGPKYDPRDEKTDPAEALGAPLGDVTMRGPSMAPSVPPLRKEPQRTAPPPAPEPKPARASVPPPAAPHAPFHAPSAPPRVPPAPDHPALESSTARPVPAQLPEPVHFTPNLSADAFNQPVGGGTMKIGGAEGNKLAAIGALNNARGRLVIVNDADRRIVRIESPEFSIGRESGDCRLNHVGVSQPHAKIVFAMRTLSFQIEDQGSTNQTVLGTVVLNPKVPQPLPPESLLRFGPVEAVFVVARDSSNELIPPARYAAALQLLVADKVVSAEQARAATAEAAAGERHVGEALMMAGIVNARAWTRAFEMAANYRVPPPEPLRKRTKMSLVIALAVLVVIAVLVWVFRGQLGM